MLLWTQSILAGIQEKPNSKTPNGQKPFSFFLFFPLTFVHLCLLFSISALCFIFPLSLHFCPYFPFSLSCFAQSITVLPTVPLPSPSSFLTPLYSGLIADHYSVSQFSRVQLFATPWTTAHQVSLSITNSRSLLKLMSMESVMPSNHHML